jgi:hypothetical protein
MTSLTNSGAMKPAGWLQSELELQAKGLTGQLPNFWSYLNTSNWMNTKGGSEPEQFVPYYINGRPRWVRVTVTVRVRDNANLAVYTEQKGSGVGGGVMCKVWMYTASHPKTGTPWCWLKSARKSAANPTVFKFCFPFLPRILLLSIKRARRKRGYTSAGVVPEAHLSLDR